MEPSPHSNISDREWTELMDGVSVIAPPGREGEAIEFVRRLIASRTGLDLSEDQHGNLFVRFKREPKGRPIFFAAHLDHPALVVIESQNDAVRAEYRGGSASLCKAGTTARFIVEGALKSVTIHSAESVDCVSPVITLAAMPGLREGDVGMLAPTREYFACDDMVGVCACIHALDRYAQASETSPVRLIFTRAEEIGMVGAIGACKSGAIPAGSRVLVVDAREDAIDHDIVVSMSDKTGPINPRLVSECQKIGCGVKEGFVSATEAGVYGAFGYDAASISYPIQHMHNIDGEKARGETIDPTVYLRLVAQLCALMKGVSRESTKDVLTRHFNRNTPTISER